MSTVQRDVNGECETKYVINSEPSSDLSSVSNMIVTKVKNFDKCLTRNSFELGLFAGLPHYDAEKVCSSCLRRCIWLFQGLIFPDFFQLVTPVNDRGISMGLAVRDKYNFVTVTQYGS